MKLSPSLAIVAAALAVSAFGTAQARWRRDAAEDPKAAKPAPKSGNEGGGGVTIEEAETLLKGLYGGGGGGGGGGYPGAGQPYGGGLKDPLGLGALGKDPLGPYPGGSAIKDPLGPYPPIPGPGAGPYPAGKNPGNPAVLPVGPSQPYPQPLPPKDPYTGGLPPKEPYVGGLPPKDPYLGGGGLPPKDPYLGGGGLPPKDPYLGGGGLPPKDPYIGGGGAGGLPGGAIKDPAGYPPPGHGPKDPVVAQPYKPGPGGAGPLPPPKSDCLDPYDCVPFYLCQEGEIVTTGEGILDVRNYFGKGDQEAPLIGGNCPNYFDVCCKKPLDEIIVKPPIVEEYIPQCGIRHEHGLEARIAFGNQSYVAETQFGEFPWMAAVLKSQISDVKGVKEEYEVYQCGGSLIHPQVVLTAAHCVDALKYDPTPLRVRLGEWDTQREDYEIYPHEDHGVTKVIVHEKYNKGTLFNDVALLFLSEPAKLYKHIDTICLPDYGANFEGQYCTVTGWGKNNFGKVGSYQEVLKRIDVPVTSNYQCQHALRGTKLGKYFKLHPSFMCAGGEPEKDACQGDGGSPLVCLDKYRGAYVQVGIVAWGIGCGQGGVPGVYADVIQQAGWINDAVTSYFKMPTPYFDLRKAEERAGSGLTKDKTNENAPSDKKNVR